MLLVQLGINSTRDVWKFAKLDSPRRLVQFWKNFQTSLVLLIPNCTRCRMITYTNCPLHQKELQFGLFLEVERSTIHCLNFILTPRAWAPSGKYFM
jgi:hypothetical protein